jgi:hypothetical protein
MNDPRLNSIHLEFPRREDFRRARELMLESRGLHTLAVERQHEAGGGESHTMVQNAREGVPPDAEHWLLEKDAIYPLKVGVNTVGRLPDNDVVIQGPYVSRRHCAILVHAGDGCELHDIASKNGTFVNGLRLSGPTHLASGDEIRMCDRQFIFMSKAGNKDEPGQESTQSE